MPTLQSTRVSGSSRTGLGFNLPQSLWLILLALGLGLGHGLGATALIKTFGSGFGKSLGDFALILIPSFVLAACFSRQSLGGAPNLAVALAPVTAAGMVCPDTAYAALSSVAKHRKLSVAFGSFAGYRLLFPAGPLIVATGLGLDSAGLLVIGLGLLIPVWLAGETWARLRGEIAYERAGAAARNHHGAPVAAWVLLKALSPLILLGTLLVVGVVFKPIAIPALDLFTRPKGALLLAAVLAVWMTEPERRRECLDSAMNRSATLLVVVGAAGAFGLMLTATLPIGSMISGHEHGTAMLLAMFALAALFKFAYGSSTVTLAAVAPVLAPLVGGSGVSPIAAVFAICLGSLVVLPTDSFYWLVRSDALAEVEERSAIVTLCGGAAIQAVAGLFALLVAVQLGLV